MPIIPEPMSDAQHMAEEDRLAIQRSVQRMHSSYATRRREDSLNYADSVQLAIDRGPAAPVAPAAQAAHREQQEYMVEDVDDCEEEALAAPAP